MPATRTIKQSVQPAQASSRPAHFSGEPSNLSPILLPFAAPTATSPTPPTKKKRSHGKARPPGHIPRPPNAFIIFRTAYIKSMETQNSTPEMSKSLGEKWRRMSPSDKRPWIQKAEDAKIQHQVENPGYKYKPIHPRDEFGNCIRKPRKPNRPRVKKTPHGGDMLEHLPESFKWLEGMRATGFPHTELPSDASSASSPPPSPSPTPSCPIPSAPPSHQIHRRSSSVPVLGADETFFSNPSTWSVYPPTPNGFHTSQVPHRLSKRPSTSMDIMSCWPGYVDSLSLNNNLNVYPPPNDASQWRQGHRRSISAPDFSGEISQVTYAPAQAFAPHLTPINPVFGNVFDKFSWSTPNQAPNSDSASSQYTFTDYSSMPPSVASSSAQQQEYITVDIPSMSNSPTSNLPSAISPTSTPPSQLGSSPVIQHPAPISTFDFSAFQTQINQFEYNIGSRGGFENAPVSMLAQTLQPSACTVYNAEKFMAHSGVQRPIVSAVHSASDEGASTAEPSSGDAVILPHNTIDHTAADLRAYQEGARYSQQCPGITPPSLLDFNELIVDGY